MFDIISKSEEHFGADSVEVGYALVSILMLRRGGCCPLEPTVSSVELALRAYGVFSRMPQEQLTRPGKAFLHYQDLATTALVIVDYYADIASNDAIISHDEERRLLQAAVFLIEEARRIEKLRPGVAMHFKKCHSDLDAAERTLNQLKRMRRA